MPHLALVRALSSPSTADATSACLDLARRLQQGRVSAAALVQMDAVVPLLRAMQTTSADAPSSIATTSVAAAISLPQAASRLLHALQLDAHVRLFSAGWSVATDRRSGAVTYRHTESGRTQHTPPALPPQEPESADDPAAAIEPEWVACLLVELPMLCSARVVDRAANEPQWAARVRFHQPATDDAQAVSVIDIRPEVESAGSNATPAASSSTSAAAAATPVLSAEGVSRQLVLGPWQGVACAFRETESDLSYAPGAHLEAWYTCTLAAMALLVQAQSSAPSAAVVALSSSVAPATSVASFSVATAAATPRVLVIGLGGGALVSFLSLHAPSLNLEVVELNSTVVHVAERWFGVRVRKEDTHQTQHDDQSFSADDAEIDPALRAGFAGPSPGPATGVRVHTTDAAAFLASAVASSFDLVLLDVYTMGAFPAALLNAEFFASLRRVLGPDGSVAINAGVGADREAVLRLAHEAFGSTRADGSAAAGCTRLLLDRKEVTRHAEGQLDAAENAVVVAGGTLARQLKERLTVVQWRKQVQERERTTDDSVAHHDDANPPLPFELASVRTADQPDDEAASSDTATLASTAATAAVVSVMHVAWRGVELDKYAARADQARKRTAKQQAAAAAPPKLASKDDAAWSLFD